MGVLWGIIICSLFKTVNICTRSSWPATPSYPQVCTAYCANVRCLLPICHFNKFWSSMKYLLLVKTWDFFTEPSGSSLRITEAYPQACTVHCLDLRCTLYRCSWLITYFLICMSPSIDFHELLPTGESMGFILSAFGKQLTTYFSIPSHDKHIIFIFFSLNIG